MGPDSSQIHLSWIQADGMRLEWRLLTLQPTGLSVAVKAGPQLSPRSCSWDAAFCGCLIAPATSQCVIQNCWWAAPLLAGQEPSPIH